MNENFYSKLSQSLELIHNRLSKIESNIERMETKVELSLAIQRNHLVRIKNGQEISDEVILMGKPYNDLTPEKAHEIYSNQDLDFIVIDVTSSSSRFYNSLPDVIQIPLEELKTRVAEIQSKTAPILVFSEEGVRSIVACEYLVKNGFFNVNNISGGHKFWPGHRQIETPPIATA